MGPSLLQQPTMVQILTSLHLERMAKTVKYFPLRRQLQVWEHSGTPGLSCSKLTMSLVNVSLKL